jgi:hypothetical protein
MTRRILASREKFRARASNDFDAPMAAMRAAQTACGVRSGPRRRSSSSPPTSSRAHGPWCSDDADAPGALAYHDLTPDGLPSQRCW